MDFSSSVFHYLKSSSIRRVWFLLVGHTTDCKHRGGGGGGGKKKKKLTVTVSLETYPKLALTRRKRRFSLKIQQFFHMQKL